MAGMHPSGAELVRCCRFLRSVLCLLCCVWVGVGEDTLALLAVAARAGQYRGLAVDSRGMSTTCARGLGRGSAASVFAWALVGRQAVRERG